MLLRLLLCVSGRRVKKATYYHAPNYVVKMTRRHRGRSNARTQEFVLTIGRPNHAERGFIRKAKKVGEPFPIKKIQLRYFPRRNAKP
jgi:hypothetical protein